MFGSVIMLSVKWDPACLYTTDGSFRRKLRFIQTLRWKENQVTSKVRVSIGSEIVRLSRLRTTNCEPIMTQDHEIACPSDRLHTTFDSAKPRLEKGLHSIFGHARHDHCLPQCQ
jgi:hypothetical protein